LALHIAIKSGPINQALQFGETFRPSIWRAASLMVCRALWREICIQLGMPRALPARRV